jgi:hypothetical protein
MARKCLRCDLTRIYKQFEKKRAKNTPIIKEEIVVEKTKRPTRKRKVVKNELLETESIKNNNTEENIETKNDDIKEFPENI